MNLDIVLSTISFDPFNKVNWSHGRQNNLNFSYFPPPLCITQGLQLDCPCVTYTEKLNFLGMITLKMNFGH